MRKHSKRIIEGLKQDRLRGLSISQLMEKYALAKTTIWHHIHDIKVPKDKMAEIRSRQGGSKERKEKEIERAQKHAQILLADMDEDIVWLPFMIGLYWGEGTKGAFVFTNTDEDMLRIFMKFLYKYLSMTSDDIDVWVRINSKLKNSTKVRRHWADVIGVPLSQVKINLDSRHNLYRTKYGICRVYLKKGSYQLKLMHCLINTFARKTLGKECSRSSMD